MCSYKMNKQQFKRWQDLSIGLIRTLKATDARKTRLADTAENFFDILEFNGEYNEMSDWDGNHGSMSVDTYFTESFDEFEHFHRYTDEPKGNKFYHQLSAAIRAGFDLAIAPSAGVVGWFTKQDLIDACKRARSAMAFVAVDTVG